MLWPGMGLCWEKKLWKFCKKLQLKKERQDMIGVYLSFYLTFMLHLSVLSHFLSLKWLFQRHMGRSLQTLR